MRPIAWLPWSVNHKAPSGPRAMPARSDPPPVTGNSLIDPEVVIRPILEATLSTNHKLPSGPETMASGPANELESGNSLNDPDVVTRPILPGLDSVNHNAPSGPAVMPTGMLAPVGIVKSEKVCAPAPADQTRQRAAIATPVHRAIQPAHALVILVSLIVRADPAAGAS